MKKYQWNFDPCGPSARETGPVNASGEHFRFQTLSQTLVRETLQNSLDAAQHRFDPNHPVIVSYTFETFDDIENMLPNFVQGLEQHIKGCAEAYPKHQQYKDMLKFLREHHSSIPVLRISDYNTRGMEYVKEDRRNCSFYGYLIADGAHVDHGHNDGGGSKGIGKMACFNMSKLNTVVVSSYNPKYEQRVFQGATILCSHSVHEMNGIVDYPAGGFYDCHGGKPVTENESIPDLLLRAENEYGSDIYVVGVENSDEAINKTYDEITKAVLINYWPAILNGTLEVRIGDECIKQKNLDEKIKEAFTDEVQEGEKYYNPLPFYLAVKGVELGEEGCKKFGDDDEMLKLPTHQTLGHVNLFIKKSKKVKDMIICVRKPRMIVHTIAKRTAYGYSAVLICDDEQGNDLLRKTEGAAHNAWDADSMQGEEGVVARRALREMANYINACVLNFFSSESGDGCDLEGISELLRMRGESESKTGAWTTKIKQFTKEKKKVRVQPIMPDDMKPSEKTEPNDTPDYSTMEEGGDGGGSGPGPNPGPNPGPDPEPDPGPHPGPEPGPFPGPFPGPDPGPEPSPTPVDIPTTTTINNGEEEDSDEVIDDCRCTPMAFFKNGELVCRLKLDMKNTYENATVTVFVASSDGKLKRNGSDKTNILNISWAEVNGAPVKTIIENSIKNITLNTGKNVIDFKFPNNNRYKLIIEVKVPRR